MDHTLTIIRSHRRTLALHIDRSGQLSVRAPYFVTPREIEQFVHHHQDWIRSKQADIHKRKTQSPLTFAPGESIPYLGHLYRIEIRPVPQILLEAETLCVPHTFLPRVMIPRWLKTHAHSIITERVQRYARQMKLIPRAVRLSGAKTRWGSCSPNDTLSFTWRLIHCPLAIIDYIVVHELCHIVHKNHSRAYWVYVNTILPDYKVAEEWLKKHTDLLELISE